MRMIIITLSELLYGVKMEMYTLVSMYIPDIARVLNILLLVLQLQQANVNLTVLLPLEATNHTKYIHHVEIVGK